MWLTHLYKNFEGNVIFVDVRALMSFDFQHLARLARVYSVLSDTL